MCVWEYIACILNVVDNMVDKDSAAIGGCQFLA